MIIFPNTRKLMFRREQRYSACQDPLIRTGNRKTITWYDPPLKYVLPFEKYSSACSLLCDCLVVEELASMPSTSVHICKKNYFEIMEKKR